MYLQCKCSVVLTILVLLVTITSIGCSTHPMQMNDSDRVVIQVTPTKRARTLWVEAYRQNQNLLIHGALEQRRNNNRSLPTHLDITVLTADGQVLVQQISPTIYVPRRMVGHGPNFRHFDVRLNAVPATIEIVNVVLHHAPHTSSSPDIS